MSSSTGALFARGTPRRPPSRAPMGTWRDLRRCHRRKHSTISTFNKRHMAQILGTTWGEPKADGARERRDRASRGREGDERGAPRAASARPSVRRRRRRGTKKRDPPPHVCWNGDAIILCLGFLSLCAPSSHSAARSLLHVARLLLTCALSTWRSGTWRNEAREREDEGVRERTRGRRARRAVSRTVIKLLKNRNHKWF